MAMSAPFYKFDMFGDSVSLVFAFIIGIGFGFFLERAGFGNARILAAQFYFTDLRVFKVMFSAILTAMLGLFYLSWIGFIDLSLVYATPTFLLPQLIGGLVLGFGFVIGGYCPGTSAVSAATGRIDGMIYLVGLITGTFVFGEFFPLIERFYFSTPMGQVTIPAILNLPYGFVVFLIALMAIGGFAGATWIEKTMAVRRGDEKP
jgi:hypothetical protein